MVFPPHLQGVAQFLLRSVIIKGLELWKCPLHTQEGFFPLLSLSRRKRALKTLASSSAILPVPDLF